MDIRKQIYEFIEMYVDTPEPKKLCSSLQDLVEELAESKVKNITVTPCCTELKCEGCMMTVMTVIEFIYDRKYPVAIAADGGSMKFPPNVFEQIVSDYEKYKAENLPISPVSDQRELLIKYESYRSKMNIMWDEDSDNVDEFLDNQ